MTATTLENKASAQTARQIHSEETNDPLAAFSSLAPLSSALAEAKQRVEKHLQKIMLDRAKANKKNADEQGACEPLHSAMLEGLLGGGKRVRPFLLYASNTLAQQVSARESHAGQAITMQAKTRETIVEDAAAALEMIHSYSLIHDDLPAMDNDLLRRGKPTLHVKVGEGQAILAGDALLTLAFEVLAKNNNSKNNNFQSDENSEARLRLSLCFELARAAGAQGMAGGQSWDLESEQQSENSAENSTKNSAEKPTLREIHALKTGALLRAACAMGARCSEADEKLQRALRLYANHLGNAYQAIDDLRDEAHDRKRREQKNATPLPSTRLPTLLAHAPTEAMREEAVSLCRRAERALADYSEIGFEPATLLCAFARFLPTRIPQKT